MDPVSFFGLFCLVMAPLATFVLWLFFKKSIIFSVLIILMCDIVSVAFIAFFIGQKGLIHLIWATPTGIGIIVISLLSIRKIIVKPLSGLVTGFEDIAQGGGDLTRKIHINKKK